MAKTVIVLTDDPTKPCGLDVLFYLGDHTPEDTPTTTLTQRLAEIVHHFETQERPNGVPAG